MMSKNCINWLVNALLLLLLTGCDELPGQFRIWNDDKQPVPIYTQANEESRIIAYIPHRGYIDQLTWANNEWFYLRHVSDNKKAYKGYVKKKYIKSFWKDYNEWEHYDDLPLSNSDIHGWNSDMDNCFVVKGKEPVALLGNERAVEDNTYGQHLLYDTIGWLQPKTIVRHTLIPYHLHDNNVETIVTVNAKDSITGIVYAYQLSRQNEGLWKQFTWWAGHTNPNKKFFLMKWQDKIFYRLERYFERTTLDENRTFWQRYGWHLFGILLWIIVTLLVSPHSRLFALVWDAFIPYTYLLSMPYALWFMSYETVGWWCVLGFIVAVWLFGLFWRRMIGHGIRIVTTLLNGQIFSSIYEFFYAIFMLADVLWIFALATYNDYVLIIILLMIIAGIPSSKSGVDDGKVEVLDEHGFLITRGIETSSHILGDNGKTYDKV